MNKTVVWPLWVIVVILLVGLGLYFYQWHHETCDGHQWRIIGIDTEGWYVTFKCKQCGTEYTKFYAALDDIEKPLLKEYASRISKAAK